MDGLFNDLMSPIFEVELLNVHKAFSTMDSVLSLTGIPLISAHQDALSSVFSISALEKGLAHEIEKVCVERNEIRSTMNLVRHALQQFCKRRNESLNIELFSRYTSELITVIFSSLK